LDALDNATVSAHSTLASIHLALHLLLTLHGWEVCTAIRSLEHFTSFRAIPTTASQDQTNEQAQQTTLSGKAQTRHLNALTTLKALTRTQNRRHHQHQQ
jgi:hypothetical protein